MPFDAQNTQKDFPIFERKVRGKNLVYLDNASTTQKPRAVIDAVSKYFEQLNSNIHRGVHTLSERATEAYEGARAAAATFINASTPAEIIFTRNATEAINLAALSYGEANVRAGDNIVVSKLEHHSNLLPWRQLALRKKASIRTIPLADDGTLDLSGLSDLIDRKTKIVAVTQMSNVTGVIVPVEKIVHAAKKAGAATMVDGAQSVPHMPVDVRQIGCDFLAFSSHKMAGPTGVGVLYGRKKVLEKMEPVFFGGDMVKVVGRHKMAWNDLPWKFEAGTPDIAGVVGFGAALQYLIKVGMKRILEHDRELAAYAHKLLKQFPGLVIYGPEDIRRKGGIISFNIPGVHPHDIGSIFNECGIALRAGHHCCQPMMEELGVDATARISFYFYNTREDIDAAVNAIKQVYKIFRT